jgi:hypothetical protein
MYINDNKTVIFSQKPFSPGTVAHTCNPGYLVGRDQDDRSTRLAWTKKKNNKKKEILKRHVVVIPAMQEA